MELKEFQLNAVKSLFEAMDKPVRDIILKSPTGSGKTIILTYFMHQYIQSYPKTVFVWLTPGKGNLEEQSKAKMDKYIHASQTKLLSDVMTAGFEENDSCFINWEKLTKKGNNALKDSERTNFLEHIEHALNDGLRFIIIVDESHQNNTIKADEIIQYFRTEKIIRCSATPKGIAKAEVIEIPEEEVTEKDTVLDTFIKDAVTEEVEKEDGTKETVEKVPAKKMAKIVKRPVAINDIHPLWTKHPNECSDEDYKEFYRKVFHDYKEPLFWIHLNMDYPFNLKGILYFPKINTEYESIEGTIKLYNNQVFVADNIKEVIPEFLLLLKGVIDCPDLPLNVSRSALQNDGFVKKISDYITKKVADKLSGMCKTDKENYEKYWDDINPFIKFGCLKDEKFAEKMNDYIIFKNLDGKYLTLKECLEENKEKHENTVFYVTDEVEQSQYINMFKNEGIDAVILTHNIDQPFITNMESKNENLKFKRIDADLSDSFKEETSKDELKDMTEKLSKTFKDALGKENLTVNVEKLKDASISSMITLSEESRRMQDMMKMYGMAGMDPNMFGAEGQTLVLNANNDLVKYVAEHADGENTKIICEQLYDLAMLSHAPLSPEQMTGFIARSNKIMELLAK